MSTLVEQLEEMRARINGKPLIPSNRSPVLGGQVRQMRTRVTELAKLEGQLVSDLSSTLRHHDDHLLHEVRSIAAEHAARRANLFNELQVLAAQLDGSLPSTSLAPDDSAGTLLQGGTTAGPEHHYIAESHRQQRLRDALVRQLASRAAGGSVDLPDEREDMWAGDRNNL
jgi:hypothetical protein